MAFLYIYTSYNTDVFMILLIITVKYFRNFSQADMDIRTIDLFQNSFSIKFICYNIQRHILLPHLSTFSDIFYILWLENCQHF